MLGLPLEILTPHSLYEVSHSLTFEGFFSSDSHMGLGVFQNVGIIKVFLMFVPRQFYSTRQRDKHIFG